MENIIRKAIEGGWEGHAQPEPIDIELVQFEFGRSIVLDPLFWQALEKGTKWNTGMWAAIPGFTNLGRYTANPQVKKPRWFIEAMNFQEINLTESWESAIKYLEDLLALPEVK